MTPEELQEELEKDAKEARDQKALMESLLAHPGWSRLAAVIEAQIETRVRAVLATPIGEGGKSLAKQEWDKAEASGLRLSLALPKILIDVAEYTEKVTDGNGTDTTEPDGIPTGDPDWIGGEFDPGSGPDAGSSTG